MISLRQLALSSLVLALSAIALLGLALPTTAHAVVQPPVEWFDTPGKYDLWQQMWPTLNDWEFQPQPRLQGDTAGQPATASSATWASRPRQPRGCWARTIRKPRC